RPSLRFKDRESEAMTRYLARRLLQGLVVLLLVSFIGFAIFQYMGDPVLTLAGRYATQAQQAKVRHELGLDRPFYVQYAVFLGNALHGDFGMSYVTRVPALPLVLERLPASIELSLSAELIAVLVGIGLGVLASLRPRAWLGRASGVASLLGVSLPTFLTGVLLILLFSVLLGWFPSFGRGDVVPIFGGAWQTGFLSLSGLRHLVLPAITLSMFQLALLFRLTRGGMLEVLRSDFVRTAWSKGLGGRAVLFKHALRNALIPVITIVGLQFGQLIGFSIVTESIFQWPGAGNLLLKSIYESDFPVVATYIILIAIIVVLLNVIVDVTYAFIDPRIRYG
ncbi:MAG: ABC transporter permease, partial [Deinococcales bacterium]